MAENDETKQTLPAQKGTDALDVIVQTVYLDRSNAVFASVNGFLTLTYTPKPEENKPQDDKKADVKPEEDKKAGDKPEDTDKPRTYKRVYLHRAFPFDQPESYISVLDPDSNEIGMIKEIHKDFDEAAAALLDAELERKYYSPKVDKILSVKEQYGFSYWRVHTDAGELSFTLQDTYRSLLKVGSNRLFIVDIDGNRYEIPDLDKLEFKSYKKIELYL